MRVCLVLAACIATASGAFASLAPRAAAADVQVDVPKGALYEGVPFRVYIRIRNASEFTAPVVPEIPGATVRVQAVESAQSSIIRNGQRTRTVTVTYAVDVTPEAAGPLVLPTISVSADGEEQQYALPTVQILKSDSGDVFSAEVFGTPPEVYIGQSLELVLRIAVKPYRDPVYGQLNEVKMWQMMNLEGTEWGVFLPTMQRMAKERRNVPRVQTEQRDGVNWFVYEVPCTIWPPKSGAPDLGRIVVRMNYPVALREERGFLGGSQLIPDTRPVSAEAKVHPLTVLPLPDQGRPSGFTGAVGLFGIQSAAKPVDVAVGDPITLTLTLTDRTSGEANLDTLQPPLLADVSQLKKDFRVPSEPLSGTVDGRRKTFTQTIRPLRA
ncbi:MAG: BatD family protein, partial [Phycisphaerae bacterium]|nr:BatD family protein [Phycisphaerae bacterium]